MRISTLRKKLLSWYDANRRDLPWRRTSDPYRILVSEVMLQQTRVTAVLPYYDRFLKLFPSIEVLAAARPQRVLRAWAGLGYYSRARALHAAARAIAAGGFPATYDALLSLPGIGPYTAAAVSSIAFHEPHAVVDGNVRRVLSRLFGLTSGWQAKAGELLDRGRPGDFNQAMMELGAVICTPAEPCCRECPMSRGCTAFATKQLERPRARPKGALQDVQLLLAVVERGRKVLLAPPHAETLWPHFWRLPDLPLSGFRPLEQLGSFRHTVTYRRISVEVWRAAMTATNALPRGFRFCSPAELARLPLSTPSRKALTLAAARKALMNAQMDAD